MLLRQLSFGILSVNSFFTFITKEILHFSLILSFYYCLVRFRLLGYSQVKFDLILHPKVYFGQIWSQKLKFSKLTKIWYRGTMIYPHFGFNIYFSKIFVIHIFWVNLVPKSDVLSVDRNLAFMYIIMLIIIESNNFPFFFFCSKYYGQISFQFVFSIMTELSLC